MTTTVPSSLATGSHPLPATVTITGVVSAPSSTGKFLAHTIDCPRSGDTCSEHAILIAGWVLGRSEVVAVEVAAGSKVIATSPIRLPRPDVAERYPDHLEPCGYSLRLGVLGLPPEFRLTLRAVLADGSAAPLGYVLGHHEPVTSALAPRLAPLMVTSLGRMGTTWLMRLLSLHPAIVVHREYPYELMASRYWVHQLRVLSAPFDRSSSPDPDSLGADGTQVGANPGYGPLLAAAPDLLQWLGRTQVERLADFCRQSIDDFYGLVAQRQEQPGARFFAEKGLPDRLPELTWELYPGAKEVFLVRDVRDAVCSMLAFNAKRGYPSFGRDLVGSDREFVRKLADDMAVLAEAWRSRATAARLVRYEDLIASPEPVLAALLEYVGVDASPSIIRAMVERASEDTDDLVLHRTSEDPLASIGRWRRDLAPELVAECADAFGALLVEFGYEEPPA